MPYTFTNIHFTPSLIYTLCLCLVNFYLRNHGVPVQSSDCKLVRWFIIGGRAWASIRCWFNVLSWHTNLGICHCLLFHEYSKQNFVQPQVQSPVKEASIRYTRAWTKLHNKVMSLISGAYECHYAWLLPEVNSITVRDLTIHSVSSLPSSVTVCSRIQQIGLLACSSMCVNFVSIRSI